MAEIVFGLCLVGSIGALLLILYTHDRRLRNVEAGLRAVVARLDGFGRIENGSLLTVETTVQGLIDYVNGVSTGLSRPRRDA